MHCPCNFSSTSTSHMHTVPLKGYRGYDDSRLATLSRTRYFPFTQVQLFCGKKPCVQAQTQCTNVAVGCVLPVFLAHEFRLSMSERMSDYCHLCVQLGCWVHFAHPFVHGCPPLSSELTHVTAIPDSSLRSIFRHGTTRNKKERSSISGV